MSELDPHAQIQALSSIPSIRRRPHIYLGPRDGVPLANLALREAFCLSRDAASRGCCREITLTLRAGGEALIHDDGPGLPLDRDADGVTWAQQRDFATRFEAHGWYDDRLVRENGKWKFAHRTFNLIENYFTPVSTFGTE